MKQFDLVELVNLSEKYQQYNLYEGVQGIVLDTDKDMANVLFFSTKNKGDYAYLPVYNGDIQLVLDPISPSFVKFIKDNFKDFTPVQKGFKKIEFKAYQQVELLVEDEKYAKFGVHKGDIGTIMDDVAVKNYVLVDFGRLDGKNDFTGDCISVNINDLKFYNE